MLCGAGCAAVVATLDAASDGILLSDDETSTASITLFACTYILCRESSSFARREYIYIYIHIRILYRCVFTESSRVSQCALLRF